MCGIAGVVFAEASRPVPPELAQAMGAAIALCGYGASFLPPLYEDTSFWTSSPTFFFVRLGALLLMLPIAYAWNTVFSGRSPLAEFGRSSLFVYWIHVEMVYGVIAAPIKRSLPLAGSLAATLALCAVLYGLVILKNRMFASREPRASSPAPA